MLRGYKEIAEYIESSFSIKCSLWELYRYGLWKVDPLPIKRTRRSGATRGKVSADSEYVDAWVRQHFKILAM